jgi:DNA-binding NarL/FixJ family response regulator
VLAHSDELQPAILRHRANVVIVDLELSRLSAVEKLRREFPNLSIVCTHRLADEEMWTAVLAAGGDDILTPTDTRGILQSALRNAAAARAAAA